MPTYEYQCEKCGFIFEREQAISAAPLQECPECRGKVKRLISAGGGFIKRADSFAGAACDANDCTLARRGGACCGVPDVERCSRRS